MKLLLLGILLSINVNASTVVIDKLICVYDVHRTAMVYTHVHVDIKDFFKGLNRDDFEKMICERIKNIEEN